MCKRPRCVNSLYGYCLIIVIEIDYSYYCYSVTDFINMALSLEQEAGLFISLYEIYIY